jgi:hypothetical protein
MHNLNLNWPFENKATLKHKLKKNTTKSSDQLHYHIVVHARNKLVKPKIKMEKILVQMSVEMPINGKFSKSLKIRYYNYLIGLHCTFSSEKECMHDISNLSKV